MKRKRMVLGYLGRILPALSETFVVREIEGLRRLGAEVRLFSVRTPERANIQPEMERLVDEVKVVSRPLSPLFWLSHAWFALRHPARYFGSLWSSVIGAREPFKSRLRALAQFAVAPYCALLLRRAGVTHVHAHFANSPAGVAMMAAGLAGITFSFTMHAYDLFIDNLLLAEKCRRAAFLATISEFNRAYLRDRYPGLEGCPVEIVRCGVDPEEFSLVRHPLGAPPVLLAIGRLAYTKGFHTLVEACAHLAAAGVSVRCYIIGEGPERERLQGLIAQNRLAGAVYLTGRLMQHDVKEYYRRADVFVMPSCVLEGDRDGIPVVLMEAMAMGVPSVGTRVSGIPELVRDGETGLLVEQEDPSALARAVRRLLEHRDEALRLGEAGRELVREEFNIAKSTGKLLRLFTALHEAEGS